VVVVVVVVVEEGVGMATGVTVVELIGVIVVAEVVFVGRH
jgi:hypothetical protein